MKFCGHFGNVEVRGMTLLLGFGSFVEDLII